MASKGSRGTFGFRNVNGKAVKFLVTKKVSDKLMTKSAPKRLIRSIRVMINKAGKKAERTAKSPRWTPKKTGALIDTIKWNTAQISDKGNIIRGTLSAGGMSLKHNKLVNYARIQEYQNTRGKRFYLRRALLQVFRPELLKLLGDKKMYGEIFIRGAEFKGPQV